MPTTRRITATTLAAYFQILLNIAGIPFTDNLFRETKYMPIFFGCQVLIARFAGILFGILMIIGIFKKSHKLMAPSIYFGVVSLIGSGIFWIICFTFHIMNAKSNVFMYSGILFLLMEGLQFTLWYFVYSLYLEYKEEANTTQNTRTHADVSLVSIK